MTRATSARERSEIGVVGVGRLGTVLARRLAAHCPVLVWDTNPAALVRSRLPASLRVDGFHALTSQVNAVLLAVPAQATAELLAAAAAWGHPCPLFVCLATSFDPNEPVLKSKLGSLDVLSLKLVGQFKAIECGLPAKFVTAERSGVLLQRARELLAPIGDIHEGDEASVAVLNRTAARAALVTARTFLREPSLSAVSKDVLDAALRNVLVGTILDYPPETDNYYTNAILSDLDVEVDSNSG